MSKRKYTHIKLFEKEILEMKDAGKTKREIAEALGLEKEQIKDFLKRKQREVQKIAEGIIVNPQGRPSKYMSRKAFNTHRKHILS